MTHQFYKNCLHCGLIFCQQNSKLSTCTFCSHSFDQTPPTSSTAPSTLGSEVKNALLKATGLQTRLLAADSDSSSTVAIRDEYTDENSNFIQTKFCSSSEIIARQREMDAFKERIFKEQAEKSSFDLSKMLGL